MPQHLFLEATQGWNFLFHPVFKTTSGIQLHFFQNLHWVSRSCSKRPGARWRGLWEAPGPGENDIVATWTRVPYCPDYTAVTNLDEQGCYIKRVRVISMSDVDSEHGSQFYPVRIFLWSEKWFIAQTETKWNN